MSRSRAYSHALVCYCEETVHIIEHMAVFEHVTWICHDRDVNTDGDIKKKHFHVLLYTPDGKTSSAVIKSVERELLRKFGKDYFERETHDSVFAEFVRDIDGVRDYLTHSNSPDKVAYGENEVHGDFEYWLKNAGELQEQVQTAREDWTISLLGLVKSNPLRSFYIVREDLLPLVSSHGRDIILNLRRAIDSLQFIYPYLSVVSRETEVYELKQAEYKAQIEALRNAGK